MNTSLFIAKRLYNAKENNNNYTRPIIRIAISPRLAIKILLNMRVKITSSFYLFLSKMMQCISII